MSGQSLTMIVGVPLALRLWTGTELDELGQLSFDAPAMAGTLGLCLAASVVFGLVPALSATSGRLYSALKEGGRAVAGGARGRLGGEAILGRRRL